MFPVPCPEIWLVLTTSCSILGRVKPIRFDDLARSRAIDSCEAAFRGATGISLRIVPPDPLRERIKFGEFENAFCVLITSHPTGCASCQESQARLQRRAATKLAPVEISCFAGLSEGGRAGGRGREAYRHHGKRAIPRREPNERDFKLIAADFGKTFGEQWRGKVREAYFNTPVVTADKLQFVIELLAILAQHLQRHAEQQGIAESENELPVVARAKAFIQAHMDEAITLTQVAAHVHVSRFYFCKLFRKTTGITLREYVARVRLEKAKALLADPSMRISEIVFEAGFGSIQQFNSVFKQIVGVSPTVYRVGLHGQRSGNR